MASAGTKSNYNEQYLAASHTYEAVNVQGFLISLEHLSAVIDSRLGHMDEKEGSDFNLEQVWPST